MLNFSIAIALIVCDVACRCRAFVYLAWLRLGWSRHMLRLLCGLPVCRAHLGIQGGSNNHRRWTVSKVVLADVALPHVVVGSVCRLLLFGILICVCCAKGVHPVP